MEKHLQEAKKMIIQDRLDSLELRLEELANNFAHLPTEQLSKHCISCMNDIRSLAYECLIENIDRFDKSEYDQVKETLQSMRFDVNEKNLIECSYHRDDCEPQITLEERRDRFMGLKAGVPPAKLCFLPYNAHELFDKLATGLKDVAIEELKYRMHILMQAPAPSNQLSLSDNNLHDKQGGGPQYRGKLKPKAAAMLCVEDSDDDELSLTVGHSDQKFTSGNASRRGFQENHLFSENQDSQGQSFIE
ncbi:uncharacterized protein BKA55DRAFT_695714 [Fusarium redolens]|uniref:Uncharacterized protein n=1 Tax=Fusarium redolens TaxID=48865 RepID=A0A9P9G5A1_FUSRE|nr:uncharacterized protein BKA55DRAFT_695714 [Fusarium redolens]KAH7232295.1 hypothetical protein BKA55DRAFT_695714 [Fusarium redolens]